MAQNGPPQPTSEENSQRRGSSEPWPGAPSAGELGQLLAEALDGGWSACQELLERAAAPDGESAAALLGGSSLAACLPEGIPISSVASDREALAGVQLRFFAALDSLNPLFCGKVVRGEFQAITEEEFGSARFFLEQGQQSALCAFVRLAQQIEAVNLARAASAALIEICDGVLARAVSHQLGRAHPDYEDALQQARLELFRGLGRLQNPLSVYSFAKTVALRQAHRLARSFARAEPTEASDLDVLAAKKPLPDPADRIAERLDAQRLLAEILAAVTNSQQDLLDPHFSDSEIAAREGVSVVTVRSRRHRVRRRFRIAFGYRRSV